MARKQVAAPNAAENSIVITREINAPRDMVWRAFTQAEHAAKWFGPKGFTTRVEALDFCPGGKWRYVMVGPDGKEYPCQGVFTEIVPGERYVSTDEFGEEFEAPDGVELPRILDVTTSFDDLGGKTRLTIVINHATPQDREKHDKMGVVGGWQSSLDCLSAYLAGEDEDTSDREIVISRVYDAPRELVWKAWIDPATIGAWWGPEGFTTTTQSHDLRPGGEWRFVMHGPDGRDYVNRVTFQAVLEAERLSYIHGGEGEVEPLTMNTTVLFEPQEGKTKLTLRMVFPSKAERDRISRENGAVEGGIQTVGRLAAHLARSTGNTRDAVTMALPTELDMIMRRVFDAPARLVFEVYTTPEHIRQWWGCGAMEMTECEIDLRPGGKWRMAQREPGGTLHPFKGEYKEVVVPERIVQTFIYDVEGIRDHPSLETITIEERDGKTHLTIHIAHKSQLARDGHLRSGMEYGVTESMNRLEELLARA